MGRHGRQRVVANPSVKKTCNTGEPGELRAAGAYAQTGAETVIRIASLLVAPTTAI